MLSFRTALLGLLLVSPLDKCIKADATQDGPAAQTPTSVATQPQTPVSVEQSELDEAKRLCANGDCQTAHERLAIDIPQNSPIRSTPAFKELENQWATQAIAGAGNDPDVLARRRILDDVSKAPSVDPPLRDKAKQTLATMPTAAPPPLATKPAPSDLDLAKKIAAKDPRKAKEMLANKALGGTASQEEKDYLATLCKKLNDKSCLAMLKAAAQK